jgi:hypothetical protein
MKKRKPPVPRSEGRYGIGAEEGSYENTPEISREITLQMALLEQKAAHCARFAGIVFDR